jgi:hypothetical protein
MAAAAEDPSSCRLVNSTMHADLLGGR